MTKTLILTAACAATLSGCLLPPSMYERASFGPPPDYWQQQGRYRPIGGANAAPDSTPPSPTPSELAEAEAGVGASDVDSAVDPARRAEPPLYAWDGGVVDGAPEGRVSAQDGAPRGLETPPAGRMHIIELYQQVLDERDALAEEVERLRATLEQTTLALEAKQKAADELMARVEVLEASQATLRAENGDFAARLVQAQIRRLEAEKLLLETRIEGERAKAEEAARAAAALPKAGGAKAKPKSDEGGRE